MDNELENLEQYIEEVRTRLTARRRLRELNQQDIIEYPNETALNNLDSSIKKNSAFVKRLKVFSESQKAQILEEIDRLNLTKFISEVAGSITDAKLKLSDIPSVIEICTKLNRTYKEFSRHLFDQFAKYFPSPKRKNVEVLPIAQSSHNQVHYAATSSTSIPTSQVSNLVIRSQVKSSLDAPVIPLNPSKIRVDLRLFAELIVSGVFPLKDGFPVLVNFLYYLMFNERNSHTNANAIVTFCKGCGYEFLGIVPQKMQQLSVKLERDVPTCDFVPAKRQELMKSHFREYYQLLSKHSRDLHGELNELVLRNKRIRKSRGEVTGDSKELIETKHSEFSKLSNVVAQLADQLGEQVPFLSDLENPYEDEKGVDTDYNQVIADSSSSGAKSSIWDDDGTRNFYEELLDLKLMFPNLVEKASAQKKAQIQSKERATEELDLVDSSTGVLSSQDDSSCEKKGFEDDGDDKTIVSSSSSEESLNEVESSSSPSNASLVMLPEAANRVQPEQYFNKLSCCVNRDMIDNAAIDFMRFFNNKFGRRKLVKTLFNVQRTRLDLLPFYARLTATIHRYVPSIGNELVVLLKTDFRNLFKKKDQINIESKVKNVRFIGELVKFNLYSRQEALNCLRMLLSDFTHHHIEMTCNLLETCGRLLYKSVDSHHQLRLLLEQMMRKKLLLSVDSKYVTMIENAYYFTDPPEVVKQVVEEPPVHIYVRYLLCECLNRSTIDKVLQQVKKLDWGDKNLAKFVISCMVEAYNLKFYNIRYLAALLAALNKEHQWISITVIDGVVEDILLMMEINELQFNQRRIPMIRYFGELYNYRLSDSSLVFKILYSLITYGVNYPEPGQVLTQIPLSHLDPPDNLFRIKLVCDLLETCGQYLSTGQEKKKLDCYLLFLQRYYWYKKHIYMLHPYCMAKSGNQFPAAIDYLYNDTIFNLRPTFEMATSYAEATRSVRTFVDNLIANQQ